MARPWVWKEGRPPLWRVACNIIHHSRWTGCFVSASSYTEFCVCK